MPNNTPNAVDAALTIASLLAQAGPGVILGVTVLALLVGLVYFWFTSLRFVQEAELGLRLRFGKVLRDRQGNPKIYKPGALVIVPHIEQLVSFRVRQQTVAVPAQEFVLLDNTIWKVDGVIRFIITDVYKAKFAIANLDESLVRVAMAALRDAMQQVSDAAHLRDTKTISEMLRTSLLQYEEMWGIEIDEFRLRDCAPIGQTAHIITTKALIETRKTALDEAGITDPLMVAAMLGLPTVAAITSTPAMPG